MTDETMGGDMVLRGGAWFNIPRDVRSAFRFWFAPGNRSVGVGFRLARTESTGRRCVLRGGAWNNRPQIVRSASRFGLAPENRFDFVGFRLIRVEREGG